MILPTNTRIYQFHPTGLDPITVYVEQYGPAKSRITVQCYARAWTAYWGSHGDQPVESFVTQCNAEYVADNLAWGWNGLLLKRREKTELEYLLRIVKAIQAEFSKAKVAQ